MFYVRYFSINFHHGFYIKISFHIGIVYVCVCVKGSEKNYFLYMRVNGNGIEQKVE